MRLIIDYDEGRAWFEQVVIEEIAYKIISLDMETAEIMEELIEKHGSEWFCRAIKEHQKRQMRWWLGR